MTMTTDYIKEIENSNVYDIAVKTPVTRLQKISDKFKNNIFLKREDMQSIFSFKCRGSYNKISNLEEEKKKNGIVAASAGNHAQGVALASQKLGIDAIIVMPVTTPSIKVQSVKNFGVKVILYGDSFDEAYEYALELSESQNRVFIHPFDDPYVIAGQGTIALEIIDSFKEDIDIFFIPVGGGGLIAGMSTYIKHRMPDAKVIAVESEDAPTLHDAIAADRRVELDQVGLFVDGCAVKKIGEETFRLSKKYVDDTILVSIDETCAAIKDIYEDTRVLAEPAGALSIAGMKKYLNKNNIQGKNIITINSGANLNFDRLRHVTERSEVGEGKEILLAVTIPEESGSFKNFCKLIGKRSISEFNYRYSKSDYANIFVGIKAEDIENDKIEILKNLESNGYSYVDLTDNEVAKLHLRYMIGGTSNEMVNEKVFRFEFPERPGALLNFLEKMKKGWNISLFHYRNHGSAFGRVFIGISSKEDFNESDLISFLDDIGYKYHEESNNPAYTSFLK